MADESMDLCENIWNHEMAMRRLLSLLRSSQSTCNDSECFQPETTTEDGFMMMTFCWMMLAFVLYYFRPSSLRNRTPDNEKKPNGGNGDGGEPPASHAF